ncbi:MAG: hypothetical protein M3Z35_10175, partial [Nitrospirota bacterium]|nr:hypothetical protein [Nitrospirota bacterium]
MPRRPLKRGVFRWDNLRRFAPRASANPNFIEKTLAHELSQASPQAKPRDTRTPPGSIVVCTRHVQSEL